MTVLGKSSSHTSKVFTLITNAVSEFFYLKNVCFFFFLIRRIKALNVKIKLLIDFNSKVILSKIYKNLVDQKYLLELYYIFFVLNIRGKNVYPKKYLIYSFFNFSFQILSLIFLLKLIYIQF